ncbi:MAG: cobalt-precorrin-4 C(11)-methyltransferase, partial [Deltaproteobacteria bacterium SG8_13]
QTLILTRMGGRTPVPESERLERLAQHRASMAIYLSAGLAEPVAEILKKHYGNTAGCAVAYRVSQPQEKIVFTTLQELVATIRKEKITRQALIIVGRVLAVQPSSMQYKSKLYDRDFSHGFRE